MCKNTAKPIIPVSLQANREGDHRLRWWWVASYPLYIVDEGNYKLFKLFIYYCSQQQRVIFKGQPTTKVCNKTTLGTLFQRVVTISPLAVPKIVCSLFTSHNFDRCANSHSLHRPQDAVVFLAPSLLPWATGMISFANI